VKGRGEERRGEERRGEERDRERSILLCVFVLSPSVNYWDCAYYGGGRSLCLVG
jgi:hypothetical protein